MRIRFSGSQTGSRLIPRASVNETPPSACDAPRVSGPRACDKTGRIRETWPPRSSRGLGGQKRRRRAKQRPRRCLVGCGQESAAPCPSGDTRGCGACSGRTQVRGPEGRDQVFVLGRTGWQDYAQHPCQAVAAAYPADRLALAQANSLCGRAGLGGRVPRTGQDPDPARGDGAADRARQAPRFRVPCETCTRTGRRATPQGPR